MKLTEKEADWTEECPEWITLSIGPYYASISNWDNEPGEESWEWTVTEGSESWNVGRGRCRTQGHAVSDAENAIAKHWETA